MGQGRKLNEKLHSLYYSSDITGVMEPRHTKWVGLVLHMGEMTKEDNLI